MMKGLMTNLGYYDSFDLLITLKKERKSNLYI